MTRRAIVQMEKSGENSLKLSDFQAILAWYEDMGVISDSSEQPINWFSEGQTIDQSPIKNLQNLNSVRSTSKFSTQNAKNNQQNQPTNNQNQINTQNPVQNRVQSQAPQTTAPLSLPSLERAKELAAKCTSLDSLKEALTEFDGCGLKRTAKNLVFYRGADKANLMVIGEAPGREEDLVGKPFVGEPGLLLDRMLKAINIESKAAHITNLVYWRPPGNRAPSAEETAICRPFLDKQIELVNPDLILFLGGEAAKQMYQTTMGITKLRGKWKKIPGDIHKMDTIATLHPAYLLRTPIAKRLAWQDLQQIEKKLAQN